MSTCKELNNKQFVVPFMKTGLNYFSAHIVQCCVIVAPDFDNTLNNVGNKNLVQSILLQTQNILSCK